jgi:hypothetical protein
MPSLRELQQAFGHGLLCTEAARIAPFVVANGIEPAARVQIYRNNVREGFLATLRATYPVLERLVGEQYFRQLGLEYHRHCPSPSGNLHHVGQRLPGFLAEKFAGTPYDYFHDLARLEWAIQEVLVAADAGWLDLARLQPVTTDDYGKLVFHLHPATAFVTSVFPVLSIWQANQPSADHEAAIDLRSGAEHVLLLRTDDALELRRLTPPELAFLASIAAGRTLEQAVAEATAEGTIDIAAALRQYVAAGAIVDFNLATGERT